MTKWVRQTLWGVSAITILVCGICKIGSCLAVDHAAAGRLAQGQLSISDYRKVRIRSDAADRVADGLRGPGMGILSVNGKVAEVTASRIDEIVNWYNKIDTSSARWVARLELNKWAENLGAKESWDAISELEAGHGDVGKYRWLIDTLVKNVAREDPDKVLEWARIKGLKWVDDDFVIPERIELLMRSGPQAAITYADGLKYGVSQDNAYMKLARVWAEQSFNEALAFVDKLPDDGIRDSVRKQIVSDLVERDVAAAMRMYNEIDDCRFKDDLARNIAINIADQDPIKALDFISEVNLSDVERRDLEIRSAKVLMYDQPQKFASYLVSSDADEHREVLALNFGTVWSMVDPDAAGDWFASADFWQGDEALASGNVDAGIKLGSQIAEVKLREDELSGSRWIERLEYGPVKDLVIFNTIMNNSVGDYHIKFDLGGSILDESRRSLVLRKVLSEMGQDDPVLAKEMLSQSGLPRTEREALSRFIK